MHKVTGMRNRKPQGCRFLTSALHIKKSPPSPPASTPSPGSIFLWQPLQLSIRSRVVAPCLNIYFVSVSVAGGCWRAFGSSGVGHLFVIATCGGTIVSTHSVCCGLKFLYHSSLFRGLFLKDRDTRQPVKGIHFLESKTANPLNFDYIYR